MASLNRIVLIGSIETPVDLKETTEGLPVAKFDFSVERPARQDGFPSKPDIIPIVAWRQQAESLADCVPGTTLVIEGRIITRQYDDNEGRRHYVTEVEGRTIRQLDGVAAASVASPDSVPVVETKQTSKVSEGDFDFGDSNAPAGDIAVPPDFGKEVEDDIPF